MESATTANNLRAGNACSVEPDLAKGAGITTGAFNPIKIRMAFKVIVFCFSVVTLSWVFEGLRQCKEVVTVQGLGYLLGGIVLTLILVGLQGFFIYCEEHSRGRRIRKIALFDKWYVNLASKQKGDYTNRG